MSPFFLLKLSTNIKTIYSLKNTETYAHIIIVESISHLVLKLHVNVYIFPVMQWLS